MSLWISIRWTCVSELSAHCLFMYDHWERLKTGRPARIRTWTDGSACRWRWGSLWGGDWGACGCSAWACLWHNVDRMLGGRAQRAVRAPHHHLWWMSTNGAERKLKTHIDRELRGQHPAKQISHLYAWALCSGVKCMFAPCWEKVRNILYLKRHVFSNQCIFLKISPGYLLFAEHVDMTSSLFILLFHSVTVGSLSVPLPLAWTHWLTVMWKKTEEVFLPRRILACTMCVCVRVWSDEPSSSSSHTVYRLSTFLQHANKENIPIMCTRTAAIFTFS